jgi:hypothetical protein
METVNVTDISYADATALLLDVLNLRPAGIVDVVRTSDGYYIGQDPGDLGYNHFIGKPPKLHLGPGLDRTRKRWAELTKAQRIAVRARAVLPRDGEAIPLGDFGVPDAD